jgi:hypothetical protein
LSAVMFGISCLLVYCIPKLSAENPGFDGVEVSAENRVVRRCE